LFFNLGKTWVYLYEKVKEAVEGELEGRERGWLLELWFRGYQSEWNLKHTILKQKKTEVFVTIGVVMI
jgi:hypothetical protein